jgi:hypothetical protein
MKNFDMLWVDVKKAINEADDDDDNDNDNNNNNR